MGIGTFTIPLKRAIELTGGTVEVKPMTFKQIEMGSISELTGGNIGISGIPIFDPAYKTILIGKIVDHYWNREIGVESLDLFQQKMRTKLNEIMPFYNQLYKSTEIQYEALSTINIKTESTNTSTGTENTTGNTDATGETTNASRSVSSTTPQTMLAENEDYASAAADTNSKSVSASGNQSSALSTSEAEAIGDTLVSGYQGSPADLIMRYRDSLLNIDLMVIRDLEEMFMQVFDNADSYTERGIGYYGYY
jgi:hypothetical protein